MVKILFIIDIYRYSKKPDLLLKMMEFPAVIQNTTKNLSGKNQCGIHRIIKVIFWELCR